MSAQFDDEIIENFVSVTGETKERAIFFLEMANGDLEVHICVVEFLIYLCDLFTLK